MRGLLERWLAMRRGPLPYREVIEKALSKGFDDGQYVVMIESLSLKIAGRSKRPLREVSRQVDRADEILVAHSRSYPRRLAEACLEIEKTGVWNP